MTHALTVARRLLAATLLCGLHVLANASPGPLFVPYDGAGNVLVIDAEAGTGAWSGSIEQSDFPPAPSPLSLVSVVYFQLDPSRQTLSGTFEFTSAADLSSTLFGKVSGQYVDRDILLTGGQFSIDYAIRGGTGAFAGATGYALSFVDFEPSAVFDNYAEAGQLVVSVPEPGTLVLALAGLVLLTLVRGAAPRRSAAGPADVRA